jgi:phospholipid transport system transporter-binding protein
MRMLALPAQLTLRDAKATLAALTPAIAAAPAGTIVLDASALTHIDSSALAVLLECRRMAEQRQCKFEVQNAPPRLAELARLYGVQELLALH